MKTDIYITHELIMETSKLYAPNCLKYAKMDFDRIDYIEKSHNGTFHIVHGLIHLYGYKIAGDGYYGGFFDVINQQFYTRDYIKNATIIEHKDECIYTSPVEPRRLRK